MKNKKQFTQGLLLGVLVLLVVAWTVTSGVLNSNQFFTTGNRAGIKNGALTTNQNIRGLTVPTGAALTNLGETRLVGPVTHSSVVTNAAAVYGTGTDAGQYKYGGTNGVNGSFVTVGADALGTSLLFNTNHLIIDPSGNLFTLAGVFVGGSLQLGTGGELYLGGSDARIFSLGGDSVGMKGALGAGLRMLHFGPTHDALYPAIITNVGPGLLIAGSDGVLRNTNNLTVGGSISFGGAITATNVSVSLTADNQSVSATNRSYILLSSDNGTAGNRTFVLSSGTGAGHYLELEWIGTNAGEIADDSAATGGGNVRLSAVWTPTQYDVLILRWNGTDWVERGRSPN